MKALRWTLLGVAWLLAGSVALVVTLYLVAVAINWNDQPPSADARAFAAALDDLPPVADEDNGYVYLLGFGARRDADPLQVGTARAEWIRDLNSKRVLDRNSDAYPPEPADALNAALRELVAPCDQQWDAACFAQLESSAERITLIVENERWWLERYQTLLGYSAWRQIDSYDIGGPWPRYVDVRWAQTLYFLNVWTVARQGDAAAVQQLLSRDLKLWRLANQQSDHLLGKAIAQSQIRQHFEWSNLIVRRLPRESALQAIPEAWRIAISTDERSLRRALTGELRFLQSTTFGFKTRGTDSASAITDYTGSTWDRLNTRLALALLQPQDTVNRWAGDYLTLADLFDAPYGELAAALASAHAVEQRGFEWEGVGGTVYNVTGDLLRATGTNISSFARRFADLEGMRRAALLTAELRSRGVAASDLPRELAAAVSRNPYSDEPFGWDADSESVVFEGLESAPRGHYAFLY